ASTQDEPDAESAWNTGNSPWDNEQPDSAIAEQPESGLLELPDSVQVADETQPEAIQSPASEPEPAWLSVDGGMLERDDLGREDPASEDPASKDPAERLEAGIRDSEAFLSGEHPVASGSSPVDAEVNANDVKSNETGAAANESNAAVNQSEAAPETGSAAFSLLDSVELAATEATQDPDPGNAPLQDSSNAFLQVPDEVVAPEDAAERVAPERQIIPNDRLDDSFPTMESMNAQDVLDPFNLQTEEPKQNSLLEAFGIGDEAVSDVLPETQEDAEQLGGQPEEQPAEPSGEPGAPAAESEQATAESVDSVDPATGAEAEEEESVEAYMERLLARMRGEGFDEPPEDVAIDKPAAIIQEAETTHVSPQPGPSSQQPDETAAMSLSSIQESFEEQFSGDQGVAAEPGLTGSEGQDAQTGVSARGKQTEAIDVAGLTPQQAAVLQAKEAESRQTKSTNADQSARINAMRELANTNARSAIVKSNRNRVVSAFLFKGGIALVGFVVAGALIAINGLSVNIGLVATIAALLVGAIWGWDAFTTLVSFSRLQSSDKQAEAAVGKGADSEEIGTAVLDDADNAGSAS
ncbi:MAG TPA: hypothetical protein DDW52_01250, partial [Planctomycetaceae bacterium]|nr:hypothetical protein [Planctomycetaceae bacterium]